MIDMSTIYTYYGGAPWPLLEAINSSGALTPDGTEFFAPGINNESWGIVQAVMANAGILPNGVTEAAGASQYVEAIGKGFAVGPGIGGDWWLNEDPSVTGHKCVLLQGQGLLRASYTDLDAVVYVGDPNNALVAAGGGSGLSRGAFYHADNADGTSPNPAGAWLIMPDTRGRSGRGKDVTATVDPQGALRFLGDNQLDAMQKITGAMGNMFQQVTGVSSGVFSQATLSSLGTGGGNSSRTITFDSSGSTSPNPAKTDDFETRTANYLDCKFVTF